MDIAERSKGLALRFNLRGAKKSILDRRVSEREQKMSILSASPEDEDRSNATRLKNVSDEYIAQMYSIIEINRAVIPELAARKEGETLKAKDEILQALTPEEREISRGYLDQFLGNLGSILDSGGPRSSSEVTVKMPNRGAGAAISHLIMQTAYRAKAGPPDYLLRNSLLVSAISTFEVLFGQLARAVSSVNSSALSDSEHTFTIDDLAKFESLDDAREYLIEKRVSSLLRDSVDVWEKWLKRQTGGVSMQALPVSWSLVRESFARRNLLVHTGGVVNHLYIAVVAKLGLPESATVRPGERIDVDAEYLDRVLQELLALGHTLICAVGVKLYVKNRDIYLRAAINAARDFSFWHADRASRVVCSYLLTNKLNRRDEMMTKVRQWVAIKEVEGLGSIRSELEAWDTSGLDPSIAHCKNILLDDLEEGARVVEVLISQGDLSRFEVAFDPLYKKLARPVFRENQGEGESKELAKEDGV
ncbi:hypothetical protein AB0G97_02215 [Streptomyces sp. NPDC020755]|uniref:hypothetical protein n=1 Tax=Streptomyces sp. NPDC020755 TaxID=3154790 RepID=UPI0033C3F5E5